MVDEDGSLWQRFGIRSRSSFLFINQDGTFDQTGFGSVDEERLVSEVERLTAS